MRSKDKGGDEKTLLSKSGKFCGDINRDQIAFEWQQMIIIKIRYIISKLKTQTYHKSSVQ